MELSGKMVFNRVAIKKIEIPEKKTSLILPEEVKSKKNPWEIYEDHPNQGIVVGVGDQVTCCEVGDTVLIRDGIMMHILLDKDKAYHIIYEQDILLVRKNGST
jgi:co-chaperonin GroES (HSP10)